MIPIKASKLLIYREVWQNPRIRDRAERLMRNITAEETLYDVDDEKLADIVREMKLGSRPVMGMRNECKPVVIFNHWRFDEPLELYLARRNKYPELFSWPTVKFAGDRGFDWRESGSARYRRRTGLVCNPAWQIHSVGGCPFRCAYCSLGWSINILMNFEEYMARLDARIDRFAPGQKLFQYDNETDTVCFEPEYDAVRQLVEYFARKPGKWLELYVGKSDNVDFLLDLEHHGKTICCWSLSARTQSALFEWRTANMEERIEAMRRCREAGYDVRVRFSPIIPVRNWQEENCEMIEMLFNRVQPDLVTFETLRFMDYDKIVRYMDLDLLDPDWLEAMEEAKGKSHKQGCEIPREWRLKVYRFIIRQLERVSPQTPYALCRAEREVWDILAEDLSRHGQSPDDYVCNCGPYSTPDDPRLKPLAPPYS